MSVALALAETSARPIVLLDHDGVVRLVNSSFERCLGWSRGELVGERWVDRCTPASARASTGRFLNGANAGTACSERITALGRDGTRYHIEMKVARVGDGDSSSLLASFLEAVPIDEPDALVRDLRYEISVAEGEFGRLRWFAAPRAIARPEAATCYEALHGLNEPCRGCPLREPGPWPRSVVRSRKDEERAFDVITATLTPDHSAQVHVHRLSDALLSTLVDARIDALAVTAGLSERECSVFRYLVMGRSLQDIAEILGISLRTVKFHQANVIEKLGADSRADITRLIF